MQKCIHFIVSGRVQGVFFRAGARQQARALGITGWVSNLANGRVEGIACGDEVALRDFLGWLSQGPPHAAVDEVETEERSKEIFPDFDIR